MPRRVQEAAHPFAADAAPLVLGLAAWVAADHDPAAAAWALPPSLHELALALGERARLLDLRVLRPVGDPRVPTLAADTPECGSLRAGHGAPASFALAAALEEQHARLLHRLLLRHALALGAGRVALRAREARVGLVAGRALHRPELFRHAGLFHGREVPPFPATASRGCPPGRWRRSPGALPLRLADAARILLRVLALLGFGLLAGYPADLLLVLVAVADRAHPHAPRRFLGREFAVLVGDILRMLAAAVCLVDAALHLLGVERRFSRGCVTASYLPQPPRPSLCTASFIASSNSAPCSAACVSCFSAASM